MRKKMRKSKDGKGEGLEKGRDWKARDERIARDERKAREMCLVP